MKLGDSMGGGDKALLVASVNYASFLRSPLDAPFSFNDIQP